MSDLEVSPSNLQEYTLQRKPSFRMFHCLSMQTDFNIQPTLEFPLWVLSVSIFNSRVTSSCLAACSQITSSSLISQYSFREYLYFNIKLGKNKNRKINLQQDQNQSSQLNINLEGIVQLLGWSLTADNSGLIVFCFFYIQNMVNKYQG